MSRSVPWRRSCPDKVSSRIRRASRAQIYLLRATGPTGFLLTAEGDERKFKVFLGDPHSCTCPVFVKERDLCIHILWVLIKKFRVPKENSVIYQLGLVEREIGEVVRGLFTNTGINKATVNNKNCEQTDSREKLSKKEITEEDVCPICQEDLFGKSQPTTYCKYGCGNSIHIKCMKIWAEHQKSSGEPIINCPLCRVDFGTFEVIKTEYLKSAGTNRQRTDIHLGAVCAQCDVSPISGKCYRCTVCSDYQLCKECFASDPHPQHSFVARQRPNQRWRPASKFQPIPSAVTSDLQSREITEDDYNILLQLDSSSVSQASVPGHVLNSFPIERVANDNHRLVSGDEKCGVCFCGYRPSQVVRRLPCKHEFHRSCIDSWLSNEHNTCPIDGQVVHSLLTGSRFSRESSATAASGPNLNQQNHRQRSLAARNVSLSSMVKRQKKSSAEQEGRLLQNFSLNGLGLGQRNVEPSSEVPGRPTRTNSAPLPPEQTSQQIESSSRHITFDANMMLGRHVVPAERILRYGRHSGDSRLRRCMGLTEQSKNKKMGPKSLSLDNISLSGRKILTREFNNVCSTSNAVISKRSSQNFANHDVSLINTPLVTSSTANSSYQTPVDI